MRASWLLLLLLILTGCVSSQAHESSQTLVNMRPSMLDLTEVRRSQPLGADETFRITRLLEDEGQSALLVQVRTGLPLHFHQRTQEVLYLLDGEGILQLDQERIPIRTGTVVRIQPAQLHTFVNQGSTPAVFLVVTSPRFDERDRIMVDAPP